MKDSKIFGERESPGLRWKYETHLKDHTSLSDSTIEKYCNVISGFLEKCQKGCRVSDVNRYIRSRCLKKSNYYVQFAMRHLFQMLNKEHLLKHLKHRKQPPRQKLKPIVELKRLLEIIDKIPNPEYRLISRILIETGARVTEVITLKAEQVREIGEEVQLLLHSKGNQEHFVHLVRKETKKQLMKRVNEIGSGHLFLGDRKSKTYYHYYYLGIREVFRDNEIKNFGTHGFRTNFVVFLRKSGADTETIRRAVGHSSIMTTQRYFEHELIDIKKKVADLFYKTNYVE